MLKVNIIVVFNQDSSKMLMCKRLKDPYKGLYNFVGGKVLNNENELEAAYRELYEETNISKKDIDLVFMMDLFYYLANEQVQVFFGVLKKEVEIFGDENPLVWLDFNHNFFDSNIFAGEGNIGHIMEHIWLFKDKLIE